MWETFLEKYLLHNNVRGRGNNILLAQIVNYAVLTKLNICMFYDNFARNGTENSVNKYVKICETIE